LPLFTNLSVMYNHAVFTELQNHSNVTFICPIESDSNISISFRDTFSDRFGYMPGLIGAYAYDGLHVIAHALEHANNTGDDFTKRIANTDYRFGVTGKIRFLETGDIINNTRICTTSDFF
jgi:ABC-type branched-subunit amino acid transport system substrate-binding protein